MSISSRIHDTIEQWQAEWKERLRGWAADVIRWGIELILDVIGQKAAPTLTPLISKIEAETTIPPELQPIFDEIKAPSGEWAAFLAQSAAGTVVGGALMKIIDYILRPISFGLSKAPLYDIPEPPFLTALWLRGKLPDDQFKSLCNWLGISDEHVEQFKELSQIRLDPGTITRIWLRNKAEYETLWTDLKDQGWDDSRIAVMKELSKIIPPLADMVRFADFAAFDPEVIEKWREFYDAPGWIREPFSLLGVEEDWANKYWFSHWIQPGRFELGEMHRRNLISDDDVKLAYRTMGYSPFWQDFLLNLVRAVPTRVDVRRWWDMRTIDEARLREIYHAQGYYDKDLEDYVLWTKVYVAFPDLVARFKNGWLAESDVKSELIALGMPSERVEEMWQTKFKKVATERVIKERDLTKAEIVKGVKKGVIPWNEGLTRLQEMGYDIDESDFILAINIEALAGSPETSLEIMKLTQLYRKSQGLSAKIPPDDLIQAEKDAIEAKKAETEAKEKGLKDEKLAPYLKAASDAEYRFRQLLIQWKEATK